MGDTKMAQMQINVTKDEQPKMTIVAESLEMAAKIYADDHELQGYMTKIGPEAMSLIMPDMTIYRLEISKKASSSRSNGERKASKKSKEPEYAADKVYVQLAGIKVKDSQKWALITRLKDDDGDNKAGKAVKLIESLRMSIFRETGKGQFYFNSYTDQMGVTLSEPRWVVSDSHKADVVAKLAESGIEVIDSQ
jgi:hypothetical protein